MFIRSCGDSIEHPTLTLTIEIRPSIMLLLKYNCFDLDLKHLDRILLTQNHQHKRSNHYREGRCSALDRSEGLVLDNRDGGNLLQLPHQLQCLFFNEG